MGIFHVWFLSVLLSLVFSCLYITCVMVTVALSPTAFWIFGHRAAWRHRFPRPMWSKILSRLVARSGCSTYDFDIFHTLSQGTKRKYCSVLGKTLHLEATQIGSWPKKRSGLYVSTYFSMFDYVNSVPFWWLMVGNKYSLSQFIEVVVYLNPLTTTVLTYDMRHWDTKNPRSFYRFCCIFC